MSFQLDVNNKRELGVEMAVAQLKEIIGSRASQDATAFLVAMDSDIQ